MIEDEEKVTIEQRASTLRLWEEIETVETTIAARVRGMETPLHNVCGVGCRFTG